jgi:hypothetical protein
VRGAGSLRLVTLVNVEYPISRVLEFYGEIDGH